MGTVSAGGTRRKCGVNTLTDIINVKYMDEEEERAVPGSEGGGGPRRA